VVEDAEVGKGLLGHALTRVVLETLVAANVSTKWRPGTYGSSS
jgi:hypothetical protein